MLQKEFKNSKLAYENYLRCYLKLRILDNPPITYLYPNNLESWRAANHLFFRRQLEYLSSNNGTNTLNWEFKDIVQFN